MVRCCTWWGTPCCNLGWVSFTLAVWTFAIQHTHWRSVAIEQLQPCCKPQLKQGANWRAVSGSHFLDVNVKKRHLSSAVSFPGSPHPLLGQSHKWIVGCYFYFTLREAKRATSGQKKEHIEVSFPCLPFTSSTCFSPQKKNHPKETMTLGLLPCQAYSGSQKLVLSFCLVWWHEHTTSNANTKA